MANAVNMSHLNLFQRLDQKFKGGQFDRLRIHRFIVSEAFIPNSSRVLRIAVNAETQRRLAVTAIALKRFELRHGKPPSNLLALTPEFLTQVPIDPMSVHYV